MSFARLYKFAAGLGQYPVRLEGVIDTKAKALSSQDELHYVPVDLDPEVSLGHIKQYRLSQGVYNPDPLWVTEIRYFKDLNVCWRRFVCCKELMHVFDNTDERTDTLEKFEQLLDEIEAPLPADAQSPMYRTESITKWMAVLILCPKPVREFLRPQWEAGEMSDYEVALELRIPEVLIPSIMSPRYDLVYNLLVAPFEDQLELE